VTSIAGGTITTSFSYDANGNQTSGLGRTTTWTSYNKPASITQGASTISFLDDPDHQRFQQITPQGTTLYFDSFGAHAEYLPGSGQWNEYLRVGNVLVGVRFLALATETVTLRYFHTDHLGSIAVITDGSGAVAERLSYDAWGKRRFSNGADDPSGSITSATTRGFTGEEELSVNGLVHLNGRVYDSLLGRMMSADPTVPDPYNPQAWNRYSYVGNDPLTFTDPTGYSWLSSFFSAIGNFFRSIFSNSIVRAIVQIALAILLTPANPLAIQVFLAAAASAAVVTGLAGGKLGQILRAGVIAGAQALAFFEVGNFTTPALASTDPAVQLGGYIENVAGHAAVGCLSAVASGGQCGPGALSAGVADAAAPVIGGIAQGNALLGGAQARSAASPPSPAAENSPTVRSPQRSDISLTHRSTNI
jgi:RHS repeat-associated protein